MPRDRSTPKTKWGGGGNVQLDQLSHAGLNGYVQYIYTIPEPSTIVLAGLAGLAFFQRQRMRKLKRPV
ncbi:MAG: PEP-CTERM sorting domain-containing protein [Verrucomicrobia bacterium]|nr:MAG: PEP-CTERM sorting domain-containing protein [Verrucomicrobiota bacterium]